MLLCLKLYSNILCSPGVPWRAFIATGSSSVSRTMDAAYPKFVQLFHLTSTEKNYFIKKKSQKKELFFL